MCDVSETRKKQVCAADKERVPPLGSSHIPFRGPRAPRRRRSPVTAIAVTAVIGVLAVVIAMLSYQAATNDSGSGNSNDLSALEARVDLLDGRLLAVQKRLLAAQKTTQRAAADAKSAAARAKATLAAARKKPRAVTPQPGLAHCLTQVQREIDDLQAYLAFRTPPRRDRVSGTCRTLLTPRFARG